MSKFRWIFKHFLAAAFYYSGAIAVSNWLRRVRGKSDLKILVYHGVDDRLNLIDMFMPVGLFEEQMRFLARTNHVDVASLGDAVARLKAGRSFKRDTVVVTIDDGYRDNYECAYPILKNYGIPALIYLTTGPIDRGSTTFIDAVLRAVEDTTKRTVDLSEFGLGVLGLSTHAEKKTAVEAIDRYGKHLDEKAREQFLSMVVRKLGFNMNDQDIRKGMLTWDDIRKMASDRLIQFGAHTVNHPVLSRLAVDRVRNEVKASKNRIETETGRSVRHFAYPYGSRSAVNTVVEQTVRGSGFESAAVLYREPVNTLNRYRLGRVMVSESMVSRPWGGFSRCLFAAEISGVFDLFRRQ